MITDKKFCRFSAAQRLTHHPCTPICSAASDASTVGVAGREHDTPMQDCSLIQPAKPGGCNSSFPGSDRREHELHKRGP
jgi:hypothetical protein